MEKDFYVVLKFFVDRKGIPLNQIALSVGKTRQYFYQIMRHKYDLPSDEVLNKLSHALGLSQDEALYLKMLAWRQRAPGEIKQLLDQGYNFHIGGIKLEKGDASHAKNPMPSALTKEDLPKIAALVYAELKKMERKRGGEKSK